jgi:hypothetical protein
VNRIGGAFRVPFGPFFGGFLAHTTSMNLQIRQKTASNVPPKSIHPLFTTRSEPALWHNAIMKTHTMLFVLMAIAATAGFADDRQPLSYTFVEAEYAIDSSIEIYGNSSDSDNAFAMGGSWQISRHFVLWGRFNSASYDLPNFGEHLNIQLGTIGAMYRIPIREGGNSPLDFLVGLSFEYQNTDILTQLGGETFSDPGMGFAVVRAVISCAMVLANGLAVESGA